MRFYVAGHALIRKEGKYLAIRRSKINDYQPLKWDIPGGLVQPGETLEDAIYREVTEETALNIKIRHIVHLYTNRDQIPIRETFQAVYLTEFLSGEVQLHLAEHDIYQWLDYDAFSQLDTIAFLKDLIRCYNPIDQIN